MGGIGVPYTDDICVDVQATVGGSFIAQNTYEHGVVSFIRARLVQYELYEETTIEWLLTGSHHFAAHTKQALPRPRQK